MYREVSPQVDLPALEHEVLALWNEQDTFHRSLQQRADAPLWVFYEGPPTANGTPGTHHIEARVFKDVFPRYRTMKGYHVPRKGGWDCHGLPVEIAVEKELGFTGKQDIEEYGVAEFNAKCRESVLRHVDAFEQMTARMGYWVDTNQAYWTMDPAYIDSLWWALQQIHAKGLLVQDHRVAPYCPRCGTGLSDHELAQGYETVVDPSVFVRFPVTTGPLADAGAALLVWTTTPWTLVSNSAVAVHPDVEYVLARTADGERLVVAAPLLERVLGAETQLERSFSGRELVGTGYRAPFSLVELASSDAVHTVLPADFVTITDGTGLVHLAPAFGPDDLAVGREFGLPVVNPVQPDGRFGSDIPLVGGTFFKKADEQLVTDLDERGLLFGHVPYEHSYPHCWRCHTPLMYYAQPSWYIRTTAIKDRLLEQNAATSWYPESIKDGRYGDWLANNIDWAVSRNRYWGTPLPIWRCDADHLTVVGSREELADLSGRDVKGIDPHRPFVDEVTLPCQQCGQVASRVPEVVDVWFDSGCMPFAQWGFPQHNEDTFRAQYPADYICEAIDQTRGWFYTLMTVGTLVFEQSAYRNVLCLGHILDKDGRKMSKHLGNVLEPIPLMEQHGADAVRWFMLASGSPWSARRVSHESIQEVVRKTLLTYWNTVSFQALYARLAEWAPSPTDPDVASRPLMDRWLASRTAQLVATVDSALDDFDAAGAGAHIAGFVDELSNWYVRRSRRRFWDGDPAALRTLHDAITSLTLVMAPLTPFITERVWQDLVRPTTPGAEDSVHLADWPDTTEFAVDAALPEQMALVRRLVELGRTARAVSGVKTRQPLGRALVSAAGWQQVPDELRHELAAELNVQHLEGLGSAEGELVSVSVKANFRALGKRFGKRTPVVAAAIAATDAQALSASLAAGQSASVDVAGEVVDIGADEVVVTETPREGWAVHHEGGESIALDLTLTPELRLLGLSRDVVRQVQEARKASGLQVTDRITLHWRASGDVRDALLAHGDAIAAEVLATRVVEEEPDPATVFTDADSGLRFSVTRT